MSSKLPQHVYTAGQSRAVDREAIDVHGLSGPLLMARAARAAFELLIAHEPEPELLQVLCGPGNNGGDGLLLAMLARGRGIATKVLLIDGAPRSKDAVAAATRAQSAGVVLDDYTSGCLVDRGVIVDAMLGTGINGELRSQYRDVIASVNGMQAPVLAMDVPSGIDSDTGAVCGVAVRASWTMSFITAKRGLYTGAGGEYAGACFCDDLGVPRDAYAVAGDAYEVLQLDSEIKSLSNRLPGAHKGHFGRCLVIGGDHGMGGAIILAAEAALRSGVGLVRVATRQAHLAALLARRPEAMASATDHRNALMPLLDWADAVIVGPGLGQDVWGEQLLHASLEVGKPLLLDADALNILASQGVRHLPEESVITPHPGEAARLLDVDARVVQADRFAAAEQLASNWGATVILKGNGSLLVGAKRHALCMDGNPGMASGGMGDVLSGIAGGLLAQGMLAEQAAALATVLHAQAGDRAAIDIGQRALLAADLMPNIAKLMQ